MQERSPAAIERNGGSIRWFFAIAFAFTWAFQGPGALAVLGILPGPVEGYLPFAALGIFGPAVAGSVLAWRAERRAGLRVLWAPLVHVDASPVLYLTALALPACLLSAGLLAGRLLGYTGPLVFPPDPLGTLVVSVVISVAEEVGWRGYLFPRWQQRIGALRASLAVGAVWAVWHLPMFTGQGVPLLSVPLMLVYFMAGSVFVGWLYNRGGGSLLAAVFAHLGAHLNNATRSLPDDFTPLAVQTLAFVVLAGLIVGFDRRGLERFSSSSRRTTERPRRGP